jgi:hypothetical protein
VASLAPLESSRLDNQSLLAALEVISEGNQSSEDESVAEEHKPGLSFNEYIRRYDFNLKVLTW